MKPIVIDASVAASWCLADEATEESRSVLDVVLVRSAIVPPHWETEVANALLSAERQRRISENESRRQWLELEALPIAPRKVDMQMVNSLARQHGLTIYDAAYLGLAIEQGAMLATTDGEISEAAQIAGVPLVIQK